MVENSFFADLLALQKELPKLQKTGINPHFKNKYVPLEELMQQVLPLINKHNFVLTQCPAHEDGEPTLIYGIVHTSGAKLEGTMLLLSKGADPQSQGSAITYARRYSLMSLLGLVADADDDGNQATVSQASSPRSSLAERPMTTKQADWIAELLSAKISQEKRSAYAKSVLGDHAQPRNSAEASKLIAALKDYKPEKKND